MSHHRIAYPYSGKVASILRGCLALVLMLVGVTAGFPGAGAAAPVPAVAAGPESTGARHVIILHGDGMGSEHVKAGGMYVNGAAGTLPFEAFANKTTMTHNNATGGTTDSAASATAMATGVKVNNGVISLRLPGDGAELPTLLEVHRDRARSTGLVTESYLTDASPAAYGAHETSRGNSTAIFNDFVSQTRPNVLLGGGGNGFNSATAVSQGYAVVTDRAALLGLATETQTRVAGGFGSGLIPPPGTSGRSDTLPNLSEMAGTALKILDNDPDGFFLLVEEEGIDEAAHANSAPALSLAMAEFSAAVQTVLDWVDDPTNAADWSNTLVIVLADHETGGLTVTANNGQGQIPGMAWTTTGHTQTAVPVYARGAGAEQITGAQIDNTQIFTLLYPAGSTQCSTVTLTTGADTWLDSAAASTPRGGDAKLAADGSPDGGILIRWDLSAIPAGSTFDSATVSFNLPDVDDQSASVFEFYALRRNWSEANATWNNYDSGLVWTTAGAQDPVTDRYDTILATTPTGGTPPTTLSTSLNSAGLAQLQRWVDGVDPNYGFIISDYADASSDGFRFTSFNGSVPPKLAVNYCPPAGGPTPTPLPTLPSTATATATPTATVTPVGLTALTFREGIAPAAGYAGTADTVLSQAAPTTNYGADPAGLVDGDDPPGSGNDLAALLRWDISAIPPGSAVQSAVIVLNVTNTSAGAYPLYGLARAWLEAEATWSQARVGDPWAAAGATGAADRGATALGVLSAGATGPIQITLNPAGVAAVQAWVNSPAANFGLIVAAAAVTDGADWSAGEAATATSRPALTINYLPPLASPTPTETPLPTKTPTPIATSTATNTATATPTATSTATNTATPTVTSTPTTTNTPPPGPKLYLGSSSAGTAGGVAFEDEDVLIKDMTTGAWTLYFDGSDVGLSGTDVDAFDLRADGSLLMSFDSDFTLANFGAVDDSDILRFVPTSTGAVTAGAWEWYFDGSDVGLTTSGEDVDAFAFAADGRLLVSTTDNVSVTGVSGADEDLLAFASTQVGTTTSGTWSLYFDGSDVGLANTSSEDVNGVWVDGAGKIYLTTLGSFSVTGLSGDGSDIFVCTPSSVGNTTACMFDMYWDGSANGFSGEVTDSLGIVPG